MQGLEVVEISKRYRGKRAVDRVSLNLQRGEIVGLLGPNGAGKTTSFRMIVGQVRPTSGRILLDDKPIDRMPMHRRARAGIGYLPQEPSIFRGLTVIENVEAILELQKVRNFQVTVRAHELLERIGIDHLANQMAYTLSGGEKRRLEIARALSTSPSFILLDEPFSGVDPIAVAEIQEVIYELRELGIGILITDHSVRETLEVTDRAYIINEGQILASGNAEKLVKDERVREIYLGEKFYIRTDVDLKAPVADSDDDETDAGSREESSDSRLFQKVRLELSRFEMLNDVKRCLVAVSGGPDSIALVEILSELRSELGIEIAVAHLEHGFRGEESQQDQAFVEEFCRERDIPCRAEQVSIPELLEKEGGNAQEVARRERYRFLGRAAVELECQAVATAHHADDQVETVIMELLRGAGAAGLSGIPPVAMLATRQRQFLPVASDLNSDSPQNWSDIMVIRPLLNCTKAELLAFLRRRRIRYRVDSSNESAKYLRNRVRNDLLPKLTSEFNPNLRATIANMATILRDEDQLLHSMATRAYVDVATLKDGGAISFDLPKLSKLDAALQRRVLLLAIRQLGSRRGTMTYNTCALHIESILDALHDAKPQSSIDLPGGIVALKRYRVLLLQQGEAQTQHYETVLDGDGETAIPEVRITVKAWTVERNDEFNLDALIENLPHGVFRACFDADKVEYPLTVRNRRSGDRIQPLGMRGSKKVKNLLIDQKVPIETRERTPVILDAGERVIWVTGFAQDHQTRIEDGTRKVLVIEVDDEAEAAELETV